MNHSDIAALMKGAAPAIRDFVESSVKPLADRIAELERDLEAARSVDHTAGIAAAVTDAVAKIPAAEPGKDVDMAEVTRLISEAVTKAIAEVEPRSPDAGELRALVADEVAKIPAAEPGQSVTTDDVAPMLAKMVEDAVSALPPAEPGKSVDIDDVRPMIDEAVAKAVEALPTPAKGDTGPMGKMPVAKAWDGAVAYEADVRTHNGATWQAVRDTGREPGHEDWTCLAAPGAAGKDADQIEVRGTYDEGGDYSRLNIVALNGAAFIAKTDAPGACPGDGWQMIAMRGKAGGPGQSIKGDPGKSIKGDAGPGVVALSADGDGVLTLINGDGSKVECDLYPLLAKVK